LTGQLQVDRAHGSGDALLDAGTIVSGGILSRCPGTWGASSYRLHLDQWPAARAFERRSHINVIARTQAGTEGCPDLMDEVLRSATSNVRWQRSNVEDEAASAIL
jgi:hypothetical protein